MARQTRPLTPAEAVRQGRKLIAERRLQEAARKAAMQPEALAQPEPIPGPICQPAAAGRGGAETDMGNPITEQDQRVEVVSELRAEEPPPAALNHSKAELRVANERVEQVLITPDVLQNRPRNMHAAMSAFPTSSEVAKADTHPDGAWPIADLRSGQCRFACTGFAARPDQHRFCGAPVAWLRGKPTSWCSGHLPTVCGAPGFSAGGRSLADVQRGVQG